MLIEIEKQILCLEEHQLVLDWQRRQRLEFSFVVHGLS
jgi:hypothetical protein